MNISRRTFTALASVAVAGAVVGCTGPTPTDEKSPQQSGGGASQPAGDKGTFTYWSMWKEGEPMQKVVAEAVKDFEAETDIKVDVQWQGRDNIQRTVPTLSTQTGPDLVDSSFVKIFPALVASGQWMRSTSRICSATRMAGFRDRAGSCGT